MGSGKLRNLPCFCGSREKLKRCCLGKPLDQIEYNHPHQRQEHSACKVCRELFSKDLLKKIVLDK